MLESGKVSSNQTVFMLIILVGATAIESIPSITARAAGRDSWLVPFLVMFLGVYLALVLAILGKTFPGQNLINYLQSALGTWFGKAVGLLYVFYFFHTTSLIIREFGEPLSVFVLPKTPPIVFYVIILLLCAYAINSGLEVLARTIELLFPPLMFFLFLGLVVTSNAWNLSRLLPVLENGIKPVISGSLAPGGWWGEIILLAMLLPYLKRPSDGKRCAIIAIVFLSFALSVIAFSSTAVFGPKVLRMSFPTFQLLRSIPAITFMQRIDAIMVFFWFSSMYGKTAIFYYVTVLSCAELINIRDYRPLVFPVGVILVALTTQVAENFIALIDYLSKVWPIFAFVFEYIIPTIILVIVVIRVKQNKVN